MLVTKIASEISIVLVTFEISITNVLMKCEVNKIVQKMVKLIRFEFVFETSRFSSLSWYEDWTLQLQ